MARPIGPNRAESVTDVTRPTSASSTITRVPSGGGAAVEAQAAHAAVRVAAVMQPRDRLLARVTALGEADRPILEPGLGRHRLAIELMPEAGHPRLDPGHLPRVGGPAPLSGRAASSRSVPMGVSSSARAPSASPHTNAWPAGSSRPACGTAPAAAWRARRRASRAGRPGPGRRPCGTPPGRRSLAPWASAGARSTRRPARASRHRSSHHALQVGDGVAPARSQESALKHRRHIRRVLPPHRRR